MAESQVKDFISDEEMLRMGGPTAPAPQADFISDEQMLQMQPADAPDFIPDEKLREVQGDGYLDDFWTGVKTEVSPWYVSKEEFLKDKTSGERAAEVAGGLTAAIGATVAAGKLGAMAGTAVAPGLGTIAGMTAGAFFGAVTYAIYSGIGYEDLRSRAEGQEFSIPRAAVNVGLQINPLIPSGNVMQKVLRAGVQAGVQGVVEKSYTGENFSAGVGAAGGMLSMLFTPIRKANLSPKATAELGEAITESNDTLARSLARFDDEFKPLTGFNEAKKAGSLEEWVRDLPLDFKRRVAGLSDDASAAIVEKTALKKLDKIGSEDLLNDFYKNYKQASILEEEVAKDSLNDEAFLRGFKEGTFHPVVKWIQSVRTVGKIVDDQIPIGLEDTFDAVSRADIQYRVSIAGMTKKAKKIAKDMRKAGVDGKAVGEWMDQDRALVPEKLAPFVDRYRELFNQAREVIQDAGYDIGKLDKYLPMTSLDAPDFYNKAQSEFRRIAAYARSKGVKDDIFKIPNPDVVLGDEIGESLTNLKTAFSKFRDVEITDTASFRKALDSMMDPSVAEKEVFRDIGAIYKRTGEMPETFRERDVNKNFIRYLSSNVKPVFMSPVMQDIQDKIKLVDMLGMPQTKRYLQKFYTAQSGFDVQDTLKANVNAEMNRRRASWRAGGTKIGAAKEGVLDFANWMTTLVYPNFLGTNLYANIRNMTQTWAMTAPYLKKYGVRSVGGAWADLVKMPGKNPVSKLAGIREYLESRGLNAPAEVLQDAQKSIDEGVRRSGKLGQTIDYLDNINEMLMWSYTATDDINRYLAHRSGHKLAAKLAKDPASAKKVLSDFSPKARITAQKALAAGDIGGAGDALGEYLIGSTQFYYGKTQMHQLGRDMGSLFSMFTKWPSEVGSDALYQLMYAPGSQSSRLYNTARRYAAPWALLYAAEQARQSLTSGDEKGWNRYILGRDLTAAAPVMSMNPANFDILGGPVSQAAIQAGKFAKDAATGELTQKKAINHLSKIAAPFSPIPGTSIRNEANRISKALSGKSIEEYLLQQIK